MKISYFSEGVLQVIPDKNVELTEILSDIKGLNLVAQTKALRTETNPDRQKALKEALPFVTWSGKFSYRKKTDPLLVHSGLLCLDFDSVENIKSVRAKIEKDKFVRVCFISPRGEGLKVIIAIPAEIENHGKYFATARDYFKQFYNLEADESGKDVSRACFLAADKDLYCNTQSEVFDSIREAPKAPAQDFTVSLVGLENFEPIDCGDYYSLTCPQCHKKDGYLYKNSWTIKCSHVKTCGFEVNILDERINKNIEELKNDPASKKLRKEIYSAIKHMDETVRKPFFQTLKDIFKCDFNDVKKEFKQYTKNEQREFSQGFFDHEDVNYKLPYGFTMNDSGIRNSMGITVSRKPLVVTDILHDRVERDNYANIVTWFGDRLISKTFSMKAMSSRSEIVKLKKYNYPIDSENAGDLVVFLREFLYENEGILVEKNASSQLGWHKGDFIFPHMTITKDGDQHPVHYLQDSPSAEDFEKKGNPEKLIQLIRDLKTDLAGDNYVIPMFDIYAMLSSFLLALLHQGSFVVHHFCESRHGKTLLLKLCAAIIGNPEKLLITWDGTYQFYSRTAAKFKNIPMFINEGSTRLNDQKKEVEKIIYMLAEGKSKGRALQDSGSGTSKIAEFNLVTISNGEISVLTEQGQTGSEMRVIEFTKTFGEINPIFISKLEKVINNNFGLDIEGFIKEIMKTDLDDMPLFYTFPHENGGGKNIDAKANFLISRRNQLQPIYIAGIIAEKIFNFGYDPKEIVNKIFEEISKNVKLYTGIVDTFIPWLRDWVNQFQRNFPKIVDTLIGDDQKGIPNETYGYIKDQDLCVIPSVFNSCLIKDYNGGDSKAAKGILLELKNRNLIEIESPERNCKTIRVGGMTRRVVYFEDFFDNEKFSNKIKGIANDPF